HGVAPPHHLTPSPTRPSSDLLIFSALQQTMCHLHALFQYVLVDRTIKTGFEALLQFSFTEIALLRNLCDCQRVQEMIVNNFPGLDRKSTRLNSSHVSISYAVF